MMEPITFTVKWRGGEVFGEIVHDGRKPILRCFSRHSGAQAWFRDIAGLKHWLVDRRGMPAVSTIHAGLEDCYFILTDPENQERWGVEVIPSRRLSRDYGPPLPPGAVV